MKSRWALLLPLLLVLATGGAGCADEGGERDVKATGEGGFKDVRRPVVAGSWYPGDPETLAADIDAYLNDAEVAPIEGEIVAIISPHAGYVYSGGVAAHAYALLRGRRYDSVIVVAPSHRFGFRGASIFGGDGYETPLGVVPVDRDLADAITDPANGFIYEPRAHAQEHALEIQVPFLQRTLGSFSIVPIIMGDQSESRIRLLADRIARAVKSSSPGKRVLLVASSDLSHFHDYDTAVELDSVVIERVRAFDPEGLIEALGRGDCEACGGGPIAAVMMAARQLGADRSTVVKYANSGDVTGDRSQVVGYMAAVLTRGHGHPEGDPTSSAGRAGGSREARSTKPKPYAGLTEDEERELLRLARSAIEAAVAGGAPPRSTLASEALDTDCGAFVTLHESGRLRGCIGYIRAVKPLRETVAEMAVQAALHDPRFPAVTADEVPRLDIEISVLSPLEEVDDVASIEVGRHGLIIQDAHHSGLLLPQVATEQGWDRETFLDHTCLKAGLPPGSWRRDGVTILRFTADVFGEKDLGVRG
jgi:AmmeMemoRadiSam system protein B/AmmeMemoRadiSam system protein A